jgi:hypothetical protein
LRAADNNLCACRVASANEACFGTFLREAALVFVLALLTQVSQFVVGFPVDVLEPEVVFGLFGLFVVAGPDGDAASESGAISPRMAEKALCMRGGRSQRPSGSRKWGLMGLVRDAAP